MTWFHILKVKKHIRSSTWTCNYHSKLYTLKHINHHLHTNKQNPMIRRREKHVKCVNLIHSLTSLYNISDYATDREFDRENPDGSQVFTKNALEFTWCNQNKNFWTSFTKSKRFLASELAKVLTVNFQWRRLSQKVLPSDFLFFGNMSEHCCIIICERGHGYGVLFAIRKLKLSIKWQITALLPKLSANTCICSRVISLSLIMISIM